MLNCYRVLDLTDEKGYFCGKVLSDLKADVIKVEKPGGDTGRKRGPFYHDIPHPEKSLYWFALNTNKRGITLNLECADGQNLFKELVKKADVVIESFQPGYMDKLGLGYSVLSKINPGLIMTSISPFGQKGPYRDWKGSEIVISALGGALYTVGDSDRPPLAPSYPHAYVVGGANAAVGTLIALFHRSVLGHGQYVDSPIQQAIAFVSIDVQAPWEFQRVTLRRNGRNRLRLTIKGGQTVEWPILWECKDGDIAFTLPMGPFMADHNRRLVEWMKSEGHETGRLGRWDFNTEDWLSLESVSDVYDVIEVFKAFFLNYTKMEIFNKSQELDLRIGISLDIDNMMEFPQFIERQFFQEVNYPELNTTLIHPGLPFKSSVLTCESKSRAPLIGEHNNDIYGNELGLTQEEIVALKEQGVI